MSRKERIILALMAMMLLLFTWITFDAPGYLGYWHHVLYRGGPPHFLSPCYNAAKQAAHHGDPLPESFLCSDTSTMKEIYRQLHENHLRRPSPARFKPPPSQDPR